MWEGWQKDKDATFFLFIKYITLCSTSSYHPTSVHRLMVGNRSPVDRTTPCSKSIPLHQGRRTEFTCRTNKTDDIKHHTSIQLSMDSTLEGLATDNSSWHTRCCSSRCTPKFLDCNKLCSKNNQLVGYQLGGSRLR